MIREVEVFSNNGLGNDLFLIFAGLSVLSDRPKNLIINRTRIPSMSKESYLGTQNLTMNLGGTEVIQIFKNGDSVFTALIRRKIYGVFSKLHFSPVYYKEYRSRKVGYDLKIEKLKTPLRLYGYYQSFRYFQKVQENLGNVTLRVNNPSNWFKDISELLEKDLNSCAVHLRRGDYLESENLGLYGVLDLEYFMLECQKRSNTNPNLTFYIFSDDAEAASTFSDNISQLRNVVIDDSESHDPAETLIAMSLCKSFIISNSTFSYWAAMLSKESSFTVAPGKWYRNMPDPDELIPQHWEKAEPIWLQESN